MSIKHTLPLSIALVAGLAAGLGSATTKAGPIQPAANACKYTNTTTGATATYCGPCSNETEGVTAEPVYSPACATAPKTK